MDGIYRSRRRPDRITEMERVGNNQLFEIDDIGDEKQIDEEKGEDGEIARTFCQGNRTAVYNWSSL